jgi:hypothetical protein
MIIILVISFFIIKKVLVHFYKLIITKCIIKYNLNDTIKHFLDSYSHEFDISFLLNNSEKNIIFYTDTPWSTKNNNYIYSKKEDKYYIIDKNYYYYLDSMDNFEIFINNELRSKEVKIKLFDYNKHFSKITFI